MMHRKRWVWVIVILVVLILAVVAYLQLAGVRFNFISKISNDFPLTVISRTDAGLYTWNSVYPGAPVVTAPALESGVITEVASGKGKYFVLAEEADGTEVIYASEASSYVELYSDTDLSDLTVAPDGTLVGFSRGENEVLVLDPATKTVQSLGEGRSLRLVQRGPIGTVALYVDQLVVNGRAYQAGTWSAPVVVYRGTIRGPLSTDGSSLLALIDESSATIQEWRLASLVPLHVERVNQYPGVIGAAKLFYHQGILMAARELPKWDAEAAPNLGVAPVSDLGEKTGVAIPDTIAHPVSIAAIDYQ